MVKSDPRERRYYIVVAARNHVQAAVAGGFIQANHGKKGPMSSLRAGDGILCYSSKLTFGEATPLQAFTALGEVLPGEPYVGEMGGKDFHPYRRDVAYEIAARETPIRPLLERLSFIPDKSHWGFPFRRGFFAISEEDFQLIRQSMLEDG